MAELLKEYEDFLKRYEAEKQANPSQAEEIDKKFAQENADYFAVAQKGPYDERVLKQFHQAYYGAPEQKKVKDVLAGKDKSEWTNEEIQLNNLVEKFQLTEDPASVSKDAFLEEADYSDKAAKELVFMLNGELTHADEDAKPVSFADIVKESREAANNLEYASAGGYLERYEQESAAAASDADKEELNKKFYKENPSFFMAAKKREYDGVVLDMARSEFYEDVPALEGKKNEIEAKLNGGEELSDEEKALKDKVEKYGLEEEFENRSNDIAVDLRDYPEEERDAYAGRMNWLLKQYVPEYKPKDVQEFCDIADLAEGRANAAESDKENEEEIDLLKEAEDMKRWLGYYDEEGRAASSEFKMPYSMITGISQKDPKDPNCPVDISLETGTTLQTRQKNIAMKYPSAKDGPSLEDCMTMVRMGQKRGWTVANLKGSENFKRQMFLACSLLGMEVKGYQPSPELKKQAERMILAQQEQKKANGVPTYREKALDLDARTVNGVYVPPNPKKNEEQQDEEQKKVDDKQQSGEQKGDEKKNEEKTDDSKQPEDKPKTEDKPKEEERKPLTEEEKKQVQERFDAVDKAAGAVMQELSAEKKKGEKQAKIEATMEQRKRIRAALKEAERKEAAGEPLTPADEKAKETAEKYNVMSDPKKEPKQVKLIRESDMDKDIAKTFREKTLDVQAESALKMAVLQETAAIQKAVALDNPSLDSVTTEMLKSSMEITLNSKKSFAAMNANMPKLGEMPKAEELKVGNPLSLGTDKKLSRSETLKLAGEVNSTKKHAEIRLEEQCAARGFTQPQKGNEASKQQDIGKLVARIQSGKLR